MQKNATQKKANKNITTLDEILDKKYGKRGTEKRGQWEAGFEKFKQEILTEEPPLKI